MPGRWLVVLALMLGACCAAYLMLGARGNWEFVLEFRGRKLAGLLLVALTMSSATLIFQTITGNQILTPSIMGFDALYLLLLSVLVYGLGAQAYLQMSGVVLMGLNVALLTGAALLLFGAVLRAGRQDMMRMILTGVVLAVMFRSLTAFVQRIIDPNEYAVVQGASFARFSQIDTDLLGVAAVLSGVAMCVAWQMRYRLDVLALGPVAAVSLGEPTEWGQWQALVVISVLVSVSTALVGPVAFFGLLVTSLTYLVIPSNRHAVLLPAAAMIAGIVLVGGQTLMERVLDLSTPLSVVVEFVGGVVFLVLLLRGLSR